MHTQTEQTSGRIKLLVGDLTQWAGDAIVNAANETLLGGGGVDGAIHRAAGPELLAACRNVSEVVANVRCPTGEARITPAYGMLQCQWVIHTVGPVYQNDVESKPRLKAAYTSVFDLAAQHGIRTIGLPAVSCGVYGYPLDKAAAIAIKRAQEAPERITQVVFVLYSDAVFRAFSKALSVPVK